VVADGGRALAGVLFTICGRALTLIDHSPDALDGVVAFLDPDDELATWLACRKLRDANDRHPPRAHAHAAPRRRTLD
jgi:hypothetical protein